MSTRDSSNVGQNQQAVVKIGLLQQTLAAERSAHRRTTDRLKRILYIRRTDAVRHKYALHRTRKTFDKRLLAMDYKTDVARKRAVQLRDQIEARKNKAARLRTQLAVDAAQAERDAHKVSESEKRKKEQKAREDFQQYIQQRIMNFYGV